MGRSFPFRDFRPIILYHMLIFLMSIMWAKNKIIIDIFACFSGPRTKIASPPENMPVRPKPHVCEIQFY